MTTKNTKPNNNQSTILQLEAMGFSSASVEAPRRLVASVSGKEGSGKSHFLFTAPEPVFLFDVDIGTEGVIEKFRVAGKEIYTYSVRVPKDAKQTVYQELWGDVKERIRAVYRMGEGTVGYDTQTECYELARLAHFGKLTQVLPHHYTEVKAEWREILRLAYDSPLNTILINKVKPVYINNNRTKDYEISGFDETPYMVQVDLTTFREKDADGNIHFGYTINKCRKQAELIGQEYRTVSTIGDGLLIDPIVNFEFLLNLVHGDKKK